jgi:hexosaminidase
MGARLNLLPYPRHLKLRVGKLVLPDTIPVHFENIPVDLSQNVIARLHSTQPGIPLQFLRNSRRKEALISFARKTDHLQTASHQEFYTLTISPNSISVEFPALPGLHAAIATLRQLLREYRRQLPCLEIRDWPEFPRRGVMLDVSRGRVPKLETLLDLVDHLADFKINEFQLYTEHTFAYRKYKSVWRDWGALTGSEIRKLDTRCRQLGIDLVPNQNSFGHLRYFLDHPRLRKLAEVSSPYEDASKEFVRHPTTLAPNNPGTLPFLRSLFDELLPNFSSRYFNVGCDETWDLGRGQSKALCEKLGKGQVYLNFLRQIHREVSKRKRKMMFWGDIILKHPKLIPQLRSYGKSGDVIALNWGYEQSHPFEREAKLFKKSKIPFYVCPGTSTWMTMIGRNENAMDNLLAAAEAGRKHGAIGYLITDWGDGGHPQPLAVSWLSYVFGAKLAWNPDEPHGQVRALSRDVFHDLSPYMAVAAINLGFAHRKLKYFDPNLTPLGAVIAAPPTSDRELFCRNGLKYYSRIPKRHVLSALKEIESNRELLAKGTPSTPKGKLLQTELDLAARMAAQSCKFMLWQKAVARGKTVEAKRMANVLVRELRQLQRDNDKYWPSRNKGTPPKHWPFLQWRINDLQKNPTNIS